MIIGIGVDWVNKSDISLQDETFMKHIFSLAEQEEARNHYDISMYYAERFAVKEAVFKAMNHKIPEYDDLRLVQTISEADGKPHANFLDSKFSRDYQIHVSLTNEKNNVIAFVIVEKITT